jgi:hypothetical protein
MINVKIFTFSVLSKLCRITLKNPRIRQKEEIIYTIVYKGGHLYTEKCYTTLEIDCKIHTFPKQFVKTVNQLLITHQMPLTYS